MSAEAISTAKAQLNSAIADFAVLPNSYPVRDRLLGSIEDLVRAYLVNHVEYAPHLLPGGAEQ